MEKDRNKVLNQICVHNAPVIIEGEQFRKVNERVTEFIRLIDSDYYVKNRAAPAEKVKKDIINGKWGEFFAFKFFYCDLGFPKCKIDLEIREGCKKGWVPDLPFKTINQQLPNVHVKTCSEETRIWLEERKRSLSWSFQWNNKNGKWGRDILFSNLGSMDLVTGVHLKSPTEAIIVFTAPWKLIVKSELLKHPVLENKNNIKKCIYYDDLVKVTGSK